MMRFRSRVPAFFVAVAAILALGATVTAGASAEVLSAPSKDFSIENAAKILPEGFERIGNDFVYDEGAVIITPAVAAAQALSCTANYVCLYRNANYTGDRWQFQDEQWMNLRNWDASDVVSSWKNRQGNCDNATLGWNSTEQGIGSTKSLPCTGEQASMGGWNDEASSIHG